MSGMSGRSSQSSEDAGHGIGRAIAVARFINQVEGRN